MRRVRMAAPFGDSPARPIAHIFDLNRIEY